MYSSDIGFRKESPEFYKRALKIVGKEAVDCVMTGDNYDVDVLVPQKLGIDGIWVENPITSARYAEYIKKYPPQNTIKLENFQKLPALIKHITNK